MILLAAKRKHRIVEQLALAIVVVKDRLNSIVTDNEDQRNEDGNVLVPFFHRSNEC